MRATLHAVPVTLGGAVGAALPPPVIETLRELTDFVVENSKSARAFLSTVGMPRPLRELHLAVLDEHTPPSSVPALLEPLRQGRSLGLLSEAGCPAIADPGAALVDAAHREGFRVVPHIGPSAILLALMASGFNGQRFAFCGYLPREAQARDRRIRELEQRSRREMETEIFIETPYRSDALVGALLEVCAPATRLCIACNLTMPDESIAVKPVGDWRRSRPSIGRQPVVFVLSAQT
ncbi:MAG: SAM-dependent methyltransferase [Betaproteobacteria bacterium]|nr:SAM-dependent methyltransferase [Betaproteobacteria bacterium]